MIDYSFVINQIKLDRDGLFENCNNILDDEYVFEYDGWSKDFACPYCRKNISFDIMEYDYIENFDVCEIECEHCNKLIIMEISMHRQANLDIYKREIPKELIIMDKLIDELEYGQLLMYNIKC